MIALALLLVTAEPAKASTIEVSGDVTATLWSDARELSASDDVVLTQEGGALLVSAKRATNATVSFGAAKLGKLIVRDGARVTIDGFGGKALHVVAAGTAVVVIAGKGALTLRIEGSGTSRVDAAALSVESADVTLQDAARASVKASKKLTCDLKRASRLVVTGKPAHIDKKLAGVAKLELK